MGDEKREFVAPAGAGIPEQPVLVDQPTSAQTAELRTEQPQLWAQEAQALHDEKGLDPDDHPDLVDLRVRLALRHQQLYGSSEGTADAGTPPDQSWRIGANDRTPAQLAGDLPKAMAAGGDSVDAWENLMSPRKIVVDFDDDDGLAKCLDELADSTERAGYMYREGFASLKIGAGGFCLGSTSVPAIGKLADRFPKNGETCGDNLVELGKQIRQLARAVERSKDPHESAKRQNEKLLDKFREFNHPRRKRPAEPGPDLAGTP
ncbi:MAG TPA: hypothetical protein VH561_12895 [Micromonosporaceae bacterium]|jgi:hypothetical protein